jgi:hypothetical protein
MEFHLTVLLLANDIMVDSHITDGKKIYDEEQKGLDSGSCKKKDQGEEMNRKRSRERTYHDHP